MMEYKDRVRWGPILAGLFVALSSQLVLSGLLAAIGLTSISGSGAPRSNAGGVRNAVGIVSSLIGSTVGARPSHHRVEPMHRDRISEPFT